MDLHDLRSGARDVVTASNLTYRQQVGRLALVGESALPYPKLGADAEEALRTGLVSDLHEGPAPYRPRYVLPDYHRALHQGSEFLELNPPVDFDDAIAFLSILYHHVPSITGYPVYLGDIDSLLEPYAEPLSDEELEVRLARFWRFVDRTIPDAFCHANIGPADTRLARAVLRVDRELGQVVPNLTLKWDPAVSGDGLLLAAAESICAVNKPHIANHPMIAADYPHGYGVVSCYNTLPLGGGAHTLVRLNLAESARRHRGDAAAYLERTLPEHMDALFEVMAARIRFLVEDSRFFEHSFLAAEGLIALERFTAMAGLYGVAELVETLLPGAHYGRDPEAAELAHAVVATAAELVVGQDMPHCAGDRAVLHAQSGISEDVDVTAGARVRTGEEPETVDHVLTVAPHHRYFAGGVSDILALDVTAADNPGALADLTRGAFAAGLREITFNLAGRDLVRVTGYMVRLSDIERWRDERSRLNSTALAAESVDNWHLLDRAQRVVSAETDAWPGR